MTTFRFETREAPRRQWKRQWFVGIPVIMIAVSLSVVVVRARAFDDGPAPPSLGMLRSIPVTLADGQASQLGDLIKPGVPTIINLWASWCGPCRQEAPYLADLRRQFGERQLNLIHINVRDTWSSAEERAAFMSAVGLPPTGYAVLSDDRIRQLTNANDNLVPRTLIFDRSGAPIGIISGYKPLALRRIAGFVE